VIVRDCMRCGIPCEEPSQGAGRIKNKFGKMVDVSDLVVCRLCLDRSLVSPREFWDAIWVYDGDGDEKEGEA
jgi:hypothetical protein